MTQTQPPILTGQHIGQAHYATRALLEASLAKTGTPFVNWLMASFIATAGPVVTEAAAIERITDGLKVDQATARAALEDLIATGVAARTADTPASVELTPSGDALGPQPDGRDQWDRRAALRRSLSRRPRDRAGTCSSPSPSGRTPSSARAL